MKRSRSDVCVIGGGAAGMMAAITAANAGAETVLLERGDRLGAKLRITGKGRCNVTNDCSPAEVLENVTGGAKFLNAAVRGFPPASVMDMFEQAGVPLKTERGNRVFPQSDRASDIAECLERMLREAGVRVVKARATGVTLTEGAVTAAETASGPVECAAAIVCTGGLSYPKTGSTGDGYAIARSVGHTIVPARASLVPLECGGEYCARMQGLSLKNVSISLTGSKSGKLFEELGEAQFTHFGMTGPLVLSASAHMRDESERYVLHIDFKPGLDAEQLDARILRDFGKNLNREFKNSLDELAPRLLIPVLVERSGIPPETRVNSVTRAQRRRLVELMKDYTVDIISKRPVDEAVVTAGGVALGEVDPSTMRSKLVKGLYFAGEVLDLDAYTGGFNLQIAWSTGRLAGLKAAKTIIEGRAGIG